MTPNLKVVLDFVEAHPDFTFVKHVGVRHCRRIAGQQTYSQHSWANAMDIHFTDSVSEAAFGDALAAGWRIYDDIMDAFGDQIYEHIWQRPSHYDHIHVSTWPKGWLTPPCDGGLQRIKYADGTVAYTDFPLTIKELELVDRSTPIDDGSPALAEVFAEAVAKGMYSQYTEPGDLVLADTLAAFMHRTGVLDLKEFMSKTNATLAVINDKIDALVTSDITVADVVDELVKRLAN